MTSALSLFWFRDDLRLADNPGLTAAAAQGVVLPVYILDETTPFPLGEASRWWLHHSLTCLQETLGGKLAVYQGDPKLLIPEICAQHGVTHVFWNRRYAAHDRTVDAHLKSVLKESNIHCESFASTVLWEPFSHLKSDDTPYKVFTPFYKKAVTTLPVRLPLPAPSSLCATVPSGAPRDIYSLKLLSTIPWYDHLKWDHLWSVGEKAADQALQTFLMHHVEGYQEGRNFPADSHTSHLSPHLHFGEISPHQVWHAATNFARQHPTASADAAFFCRELVWRDFSTYLLYHFPDLPTKNFQSKFDTFPWEQNPQATLLKAWQRGKTGVPIVDAGMRELWQTGYMHNRVRMIVASFLVKNLGIHWHFGRDWFWDCLVDADLANNSASWQWVAGSGADAAPYFRIFNPVTQGETFDPEGTYTRRFVPELNHLPTKWLFKPWEAPSHILQQAHVTLGLTYPHPIVDLKISRAQALQNFAQIKDV